MRIKGGGLDECTTGRAALFSWRRRIRSRPPRHGVAPAVCPSRYPEVIVQAVDADDIIAGLALCQGQRPQGQHRVGRAQLRGQSPSRRLRAAGRQPPRSRRASTPRRAWRSSVRARAAAADGRSGGAGPVLPRRALQRCLPRRLSVAGRVRLEQPHLRPGVRERRRPRRHHRRRRADPLRRRQSRRSVLGCPRRRPGLFRRGHVVLPEAVSASGRLRHQRVRVPDRAWPTRYTRGPERQRRSGPPRRDADRRLPQRARTWASTHPAIVFASPAFADSEQEAEKALALFGTCPVVDQALVKIPTCQPICRPGTTS